MTKNNSVIAILGGMGPQASAKMLEVMISMASRDFGAKNDSDFPEIVLNSVPVQNFISDQRNLKSALRILKERVKSLENLNPSSFAIACNTAHILLDDLQAVTKVPFVSIIDEVAKKVASEKISKVGLLSTPSTNKFGLYQAALQKRGITVISPLRNECAQVELIIRNVLRGRVISEDKKTLRDIALSLKSRSAEGIILGCTELPLVFPKEFGLPVFDSIEILSRSLIGQHFGKEAKSD